MNTTSCVMHVSKIDGTMTVYDDCSDDDREAFDGAEALYECDPWVDGVAIVHETRGLIYVVGEINVTDLKYSIPGG